MDRDGDGPVVLVRDSKLRLQCYPLGPNELASRFDVDNWFSLTLLREAEAIRRDNHVTGLKTVNLQCHEGREASSTIGVYARNPSDSDNHCSLEGIEQTGFTGSTDCRREVFFLGKVSTNNPSLKRTREKMFIIYINKQATAVVFGTGE